VRSLARWYALRSWYRLSLDVRLFFTRNVSLARSPGCDLFGIDCEREIWCELVSFVQGNVQEVVERIRRDFELKKAAPRLRVYLLRRNGPWKSLPAPSNTKLSGLPTRCGGCWVQGTGGVFIFADNAERCRHVFVHEVAHACLDTFPWRIPIPDSINEGYAMTLENIFFKEMPHRLNRLLRIYRAARQENTAFSVDQLCSINLSHQSRSWPSEKLFRAQSFLLTQFLLDRPRVLGNGALPSIWRSKAYTSDGSAKLIAKVIRVTPEELEEEYTNYCCQASSAAEVA